jgi:hypothetical protein
MPKGLGSFHMWVSTGITYIEEKGEPKGPNQPGKGDYSWGDYSW